MPTLEEDLDWLNSLFPRLWDKTHDRYRRMETHWPKPGAKLTQDEWERVQEIIRTRDICCTLDTPFGFTIEMHLYLAPEWREMDPVHLIGFCGKHLPTYEERVHRDAKDLAWETFEPIVRTEKNKRLLAWSGLQEPGSRAAYEY